MLVKQFAERVLKAQELYEKSYKPGAKTRSKKQRETFGERWPGKYTLSHEEAAMQACDGDVRWSYVVQLVNLTAWNDIQAWAEEITK